MPVSRPAAMLERLGRGRRLSTRFEPRPAPGYVGRCEGLRTPCYPSSRQPMGMPTVSNLKLNGAGRRR